MKFSHVWLQEWIDAGLDASALAERLTAAGLEVEQVEQMAPLDAEKLVVGVVLEAVQHPDADRLTVCQVDVGADAPIAIVCGAPNARQGLRAPVALPGARLVDGTKIRKSKIRGQVSNGMICSARELGLGEEADGVMELDGTPSPGTPFVELLETGDAVIEIGLTPNRGDCLYLEGIARDVAAVQGQRLVHRDVPPVPAGIDDTFEVQLHDTVGCPRYVGRVIRGIDASARTPLWMQERLRRCGVRALSPVVDVTNYVMLELGHPMHAFDLGTLHGHIEVRRARDGERVQLLDDSEHALSAEDLVIADAKGGVALAGVMGGAGSAVSDTTRDVFLECAWFEPRGIGVTARRLGLHTDASHRFERHVNPHGQMRAVERATALLVELVGGQPGPLVDTCEANGLPRSPCIGLRASRIERLLGEPVPDDEVARVLDNLHMQVELGELPGTWQVTPPPFRPDITLEADLIEELVRVRGYDSIAEQMPLERLHVAPRPEGRRSLHGLRRTLVARGYQEAVSYSFVDSRLQSRLDPDVKAIPLANPISSDMDVMRTSLVPGLVDAALHNVHRQQERVRLFESGLVFRDEDRGPTQQRPMLGALALGGRSPLGWDSRREEVDFYDVKGDLEALLGADAAGLTYRPADHPALHPGRAAEVLLGDQRLGLLGELHPAHVQALKLRAAPVVFELELAMLTAAGVPEFEPFSRFPGVRRDLSLLVAEEVTAEAVTDCVGQAAGDMLQNLELFDVYRGEGVDSGRKSLTLALTFQDASRTLGDSEVDASMDTIRNSLAKHLGATLRG